jgi:hypothetical protein
MMFPEASAAEVIAFLWNSHGQFLPEPRLYHPSQITRAEQDLGISRKRSSTTARQAGTPRVQRWRSVYWHHNYPFGIADIRAEDMIDLDEAGLGLETAKRGYAKARLVSRARYSGPYGHGKKLVLLMAISACPNDKLRWYDLDEQAGTDTAHFLRFMLRVLNDLPPGTPQRQKSSTHYSGISVFRKLLSTLWIQLNYVKTFIIDSSSYSAFFLLVY